MSWSSNRGRIVIIVAVAAALALAACGTSDDGADGAATAAESTATSAASTTSIADAGGVGEDDEAGETDEATTGDGSVDDGGEAEELFPDVLDASATRDGDGSWTFSATLSSPYDTPDRYADAWRVLGPDGEVYGVRELAHDHANEQPFTRSQSGIVVPDEVTTVTVQGRDQVSGWGGETFEVDLPS